MNLGEQIAGFENNIYYDITDGNNVEVVRRYDQETDEIECVSGLNIPLNSEDWTLVHPFIDPVIEAEKALKTAVVNAMNFGSDLIADYGVKNIMRGYTTSQVKQVTKDLSDIMSLLIGGALYSALEEVRAFNPTAEILQEDLDEFSLKISTYVGQ